MATKTELRAQAEEIRKMRLCFHMHCSHRRPCATCIEQENAIYSALAKLAKERDGLQKSLAFAESKWREAQEKHECAEAAAR